MLCVGLVIGVESNLLSNNIIDQYKSRYSPPAAAPPSSLHALLGLLSVTVVKTILHTSHQQSARHL